MIRGTVLLLLNAVIAGSSQAGSLALTVETPKPGQGSYFIAVHEHADTFPNGDPDHATRTQVSGEEQRIQIELPEGRYAVAVYQDLNDNQELDRNVLGLPSEPVGFSRNAGGAMAPPDFETTAVQVGAGQRGLAIRLNH